MSTFSYILRMYMCRMYEYMYMHLNMHGNVPLIRDKENMTKCNVWVFLSNTFSA